MIFVLSACCFESLSEKSTVQCYFINCKFSVCQVSCNRCAESRSKFILWLCCCHKCAL